MNLPFPARVDGLKAVTTALATAAASIIKDYLATVVEDAAYKAAVDFVNQQASKSIVLFGVAFQMTLEHGKNEQKLPPKARCQSQVD